LSAQPLNIATPTARTSAMATDGREIRATVDLQWSGTSIVIHRAERLERKRNAQGRVPDAPAPEPSRFLSVVTTRLISSSGCDVEAEVMKASYINELAEGMKVDAAFALRGKEMRAARTGDAFLSLELADRTGQLPAVCFRPQPDTSAIPVGSVVRVRGTVTSFRGQKRISVESMRAENAVDPMDFIAAGSRPTDELVAEFKLLAASVRDPQMRKVLRAVFGDAEFFARFARCPGAQTYHHAYTGGLIEHTVAVAGMCRSLAEQYPQTDADLLVCAALLHDVGKCDELAFDTSIQYTDQGRLLGHVVLGVQRVHDAIARARLKIDSGRLLRLEHAMLSHHGELEWGSPKRPSTFEALLLHHVDNLDAKAAGFVALLGAASRVEETWTDAGNLFRRPLYAPRSAEEDRYYPADEDAQHSRRTA
jgi:3'-5' exoribonuclease